jgi:Ran-binding protein 1
VHAFAFSCLTEACGGLQGDGADVEAEADVHFEPIVKLEAVEVKTMEEDEEPLWVSRAKLYRYDDEEKMWKERGLGDAKLLKHRETGRVRFLMRREKTLKICANHYLDPAMELRKSNMAENVWTWVTMADCADAEDGPRAEKVGGRQC